MPQWYSSVHYPQVFPHPLSQSFLLQLAVSSATQTAPPDGAPCTSAAPCRWSPQCPQRASAFAAIPSACAVPAPGCCSPLVDSEVSARLWGSSPDGGPIWASPGPVGMRADAAWPSQGLIIGMGYLWREVQQIVMEFHHNFLADSVVSAQLCGSSPDDGPVLAHLVGMRAGEALCWFPAPCPLVHRRR